MANIFSISTLISSGHIFPGTSLPPVPTCSRKPPRQEGCSLGKQGKVMDRLAIRQKYPPWEDFVVEQHMDNPSWCPQVLECATLEDVLRVYPAPNVAPPFKRADVGLVQPPDWYDDGRRSAPEWRFPWCKEECDR